jgi:chromate transporter
VSGGVEGERLRDGRLAEIARLFLRLGLVAFGGPAAHIAMMEDEFVTRRGWVSHEHFLDLVGATNLIPGPNSTEMTMHLGYERAGWRGLVVAGFFFILPAASITAALAWMYVTYGSLPTVEPFLFGIKPAVLVVIAAAVWRLGRSAVSNWILGTLGIVSVVVVLLGVGEIAALFAVGRVGMLWIRLTGAADSRSAARWLPILFKDSTSVALGASAVAAAGTVSLWKLGLFFLKIGAILYGSGYVLVAFLDGGLVQDYGWLTEAQLLDAVAIGQFTPGPVLSTATFIGFILDGPAGSLVSTVAIFLPSFVFVLVLNPLIPRLRDSRWLSAFLDAVNVAAVGLMLAVTIELSASVLVSWRALSIGAAAGLVFMWLRPNAAWIVIGGAVAGWALLAVS